jgi:hypothetical protein
MMKKLIFSLKFIQTIMFIGLMIPTIVMADDDPYAVNPGDDSYEYYYQEQTNDDDLYEYYQELIRPDTAYLYVDCF